MTKTRKIQNQPNRKQAFCPFGEKKANALMNLALLVFIIQGVIG